jgi:hypothetical protein
LVLASRLLLLLAHLVDPRMLLHHEEQQHQYWLPPLHGHSNPPRLRNHTSHPPTSQLLPCLHNTLLPSNHRLRQRQLSQHEHKHLLLQQLLPATSMPPVLPLSVLPV